MTDELSPRARRYGLLVTALAPVIPQVLGSAFNIWYNAIVIAPLLVTEELRHRFATTVIFYNAAVYPVAVAIWIYVIFSLRRIYHELVKGNAVASEELDQAKATKDHLSRSISLDSFAGRLSSNSLRVNNSLLHLQH